MSLQEAREAIGFFEELVSALRLAWEQGKGIWTKSKIAPIIDALRTVYFPPPGTLSILERIAGGQPVLQFEAQVQLGTYGRDEQVVVEALTRRSYDVNFRSKFLSLDSLSKMDAIAYGKINIRRSVRAILVQVSRGSDVNRDDVARTVAMIQKLNADIDELDAQLSR